VFEKKYERAKHPALDSDEDRVARACGIATKEVNVLLLSRRF